MKTWRQSICLFSIVAFVLVACSSALSPTAAPPTVDTQATVDAAVAATQEAESLAAAATLTPDTEATVAAAVAATGTAKAAIQEATATAAEEATPTVTPEAAVPPTPLPETVTMSEEELAAAIDEAVAEATAATLASAEAADQAAADGEVTQEEVDAIEEYLLDAETAIAYADELIYSYYGIYAELALETLYLLEEIEDDLYELEQYADDIDESLQIIINALEQGSDIQEEVIAQLGTAAQEAYQNSEQMQEQVTNWQSIVQQEAQKRLAEVLETMPSEIPADRKAALESALAYFNETAAALADQKLSAEELANIAQLGANASAGLEALPTPQLQSLGGSIDELTGQLASGNLAQAQAALGTLEGLLNAIPNLP